MKWILVLGFLAMVGCSHAQKKVICNRWQLKEEANPDYVSCRPIAIMEE